MKLVRAAAILTALSWTAAATGGPPGEADGRADPPAVLTIATYNINYGNARLQDVVETIREADADIVALQETNVASARYLLRRLGRTYPHRRFKHRRKAGGFAFLSKHALERVTFLRPRHGWFGTYICRIRIEDREIQIVNCHLQPVIPGRNETVVSYLIKAVKTEQVRRKEMAQILKWIDADLPTLVVGDLNAPPSFRSVERLTAAGYLDSYAAAHPHDPHKATWHWSWEGIDWKQKLDYIFHSAEFQTIGAEILTGPGSDHYMVVAELARAPARNAGDDEADDQTVAEEPDNADPEVSKTR